VTHTSDAVVQLVRLQCIQLLLSVANHKKQKALQAAQWEENLSSLLHKYMIGKKEKTEQANCADQAKQPASIS
jgi:hypothetical protein